MVEQFWVRPDELRGRASGYVGVSDRLDDILAQLQAALAAAGPCWGDDEAGQRFAQGYQEPAGRTQQAFREFAAGMGDIRRSLVVMADNYEEADQSQATRFGSGEQL